MGEYFNWVNVDRKEFISPSDFNLGNKRHDSVHRENKLLGALRELLANEWKSCRILFVGDECSVPEGVAPDLFNIINRHSIELGYEGDIFDTVIESYRNVSGLFKAAEEMAREEIGYHFKEVRDGNINDHNEYGINEKAPFEGLFQRECKKFKYTINYTKKICYSFEYTKILHMNGEENSYADPLPILVGYGRTMVPGPWLGDIVGVSDEIDDSIKILESIILDW